MTGEPEWWSLIDRDAAVREQFPTAAAVRGERIGGPADRAMRAAHEAAKAARRVETVAARTAAQEASADAFIARMEATTGMAEKRRLAVELQREIREAKRQLAWLNRVKDNRLKETA